MATSGGTQDQDTADILCGICESQHIAKCADHWCPECEEGLCSECQKHHSLSKASKTHGIISIENYKKLPQSISQIVHNCKDHDMKVTNYCPKHDTICCPVCISTNHKKCVDLMAIPELIRIAKTSSIIIGTMEQSLQDMQHNIDIAVKDRKENMSSIRKQRQHYSDEIKQIRVKINSHLDTIEQRIMGELIDVEENVKLQIENLLTELSKRSDTINEIQGTILALKEYASDLQTFLGSKSIEVEVEKQAKFVESLSEDGSLKQLNIKCSIDNNILDLVSTITTFGSVSIETGSQTGVLKTEKSKQAQIVSVVEPPSVHSINDIKLTLYSNIKIPKEISNRRRGCVICPNGKMLFTDSIKQKLAILNNDGTLDKEITCSPYYPRDVTLIDESTVAVSTSGGIRIINIDTKRPERVIKPTVVCYGIAYHKGTLLLCERSRGLIKIELSEGRITTLVEDIKLSAESFATTFGDKIFQTNHKNNSVTCYTINGEKLWEFRDESVLRQPTGVAVDNNCNIYVTSCNYNKIIVLSQDGKQWRQLLDQNDGMSGPYAIFIEKTTNNILISNYSASAFLYHIS